MKKLAIVLLSLSLLFVFISCTSDFEKAVENKDVDKIHSLYEKAENENDDELQTKYDDILCSWLDKLYNHLKDYEVSDSDIEDISTEEDAFDLVASDWEPLCAYPHGTFQIIGTPSEKVGDKCIKADDMLTSKINYIWACTKEASEEYEDAIGCFDGVKKEDCMYKKAMQKRNDCIEKSAEKLKDEAVSSIESEYFEDALDSINEIQELIDNYDVDNTKVKDSYEQATNKYIDGFVEYKIKNFDPSEYTVESDDEDDDEDEDEYDDEDEDDYYSLQDEINSELSDTSIENYEDRVATILKTKGDEYITKAKDFFTKGDVEAAIGNVDAALMFLPDDSDYKKQKAEYEKYRPFELYNEDSFFQVDDEHDHISVDLEAVANDNKKYKNAIAIYSYNSSECSVTYNLAGNYDTVSGIQFLGENSKNKNSWCVTSFFKAYGDGKLLYTSKTMDTGILPEKISFNVSGIQRLEIVFCSELYPKNVGNTVWRGTSLYVSNFVAKKNIPKQ